MKFKCLFLAILILSIILFLSYDKVEIKKEANSTLLDKLDKAHESTPNETDFPRAAQRPVSNETDDEAQVSDNNVTQNNNNVKKESTKKDNNKTTTKKEAKTNSGKPKETKTKEEIKEEPKIEETKPKQEPKPQCSDFYESITHGKIDKSSKSACISYGNKIQNNELDEVLDYNEEHDNTRKPTISYFRCYEVVDINCNTKGWYLHFFCNTSECDDKKLKSLYG